MIWFMEILKIYQKEQLEIKFYKIKNLILLNILNVMDIKEVFLLWFINFLIKKAKVVVLRMKLNKSAVS